MGVAHSLTSSSGVDWRLHLISPVVKACCSDSAAWAPLSLWCTIARSEGLRPLSHALTDAWLESEGRGCAEDAEASLENGRRQDHAGTCAPPGV